MKKCVVCLLSAIIFFLNNCASDDSTIINESCYVEFPSVCTNINYTNGTRSVLVKPIFVLSNNKDIKYFEKKLSVYKKYNNQKEAYKYCEIKNAIILVICEFSFDEMLKGSKTINQIELKIKEVLNKKIFNNKRVVKKVYLTEFELGVVWDGVPSKK